MTQVQAPISIDFSNRDLKRLIIPLIIEQLLAYTVGLADSLMVAQVGEAAVSAVSLVDSVSVLLLNAFSSLAAGGAIVAGQYLGRRETEKASRSAQQLLLLMGELSLVVTAGLYLLRPFVLDVVFGSIAPDVHAHANTYYLIVQASNFFLAVYSAGAALLRVMGNAAASMKVSMVMNLINVAGNALLIFGFHMGVAGVAIPTLISRIAAAVLILVALRRPGLPLRLELPFSFRHERTMIRNILYVGVPNGIEGSMFQLGKILLLSVVSPFGTASVAANAVGNAVCAFQILAPQSIGLGMVTVVSRCVGAGDFEKARAYTRKLIRWGYGALALTVVAIELLLPVILWAYNLSAEATRYALMIITAHGLIGVALWVPSFQLPQTLRAAGDTRYTMTVSSLSMWAFRVVLGVWLARGLGFGLLGVWGAMFVDWAFRALLFLLRYRSHRWEFSALQD